LKEKIVKFLLSLMEYARSHPRFAFAACLFAVYAIGKLLSRKLAKPKDLKNKVILITGGASGLGRLVALKCKQKYQAQVIIWDILEENVTDMRDHVNSAMVCDVTAKAKVSECAEQVLNQYGKVDILINNAGVVSGKTLFDLSEQKIRQTFDVNIISHFWTVQAFLPDMLKKKSGHIVTIASTAGCVGVSHLTDYCASKFATRGFDQALRRELIDLGHGDVIKQTVVSPYFINTGMFSGAQASDVSVVSFFTGSEFLDPNYVCNEIIDAIRYEERHLVLPYQLGKIFTLEHFLPYWFQDWMILRASNMRNFTGRIHHKGPAISVNNNRL